MGILLGLATALCWGSSDMCARFATRKIGTFRTMLYMQLSGLLLLTLMMPLLGGWERLFQSEWSRMWSWGVLAGLLNTFSTLALYRSFEIGKMSIVAPVSASYPVLTMLLSVMTGERLTMIRVVGMALAIAGVVLVARGEKAPQRNISTEAKAGASVQGAKNGRGVGLALLSAVGFGVTFWLLGVRIVLLVGAAESVWIIRIASVSATALVMLLARRSMAPPPKRDTPWILGIGLLDTSAYVFNNFGMKLEQISVVSVLASLYGAVTVLLATLILKEPVSRMQWFGIAAIFAGVLLISR
jgi:drug/metabolite transporter (DMT)-like permease